MINDAEQSSSYGAIENSDESDQVEDIGISEMVELIGFGRFNFFLLFVGTFCGFGDGSELMLILVLTQILQNEWKITHLEISLITSIVFIARIIFMPVFGYLSGKLGKKKVLTIGGVILCFSGIIAATSINIKMMLGARFIGGIAFSALYYYIPFSVEFTPCKFRILSTYCFDMGVTLGGIYTAFTAYLFLQKFSWKIWLVFVMIPSVISLIFYLILPETPYYLYHKNKIEETKQVLAKLAKYNKKDMPSEYRLKDPERNEFDTLYTDFFSKRYLLINSINIFLMFMSGLFYYGGVVLSSNILYSLNPTEAPKGNEINPQFFTNILTTSCFELPGMFICILVSHFIGRKVTFIVFWLMYTVVMTLLIFTKTSFYITVLVSIFRLLGAMPAFHAFSYVNEYYPTNIRSFAFGFLIIFYQMGAVVSPFLSNYYYINEYFVYLFYAISSFLCALVSFALTETKHMPTM